MCVAHSLSLPPFKAPDICAGHEEGAKCPKDTSKRKSASHCSLQLHHFFGEAYIGTSIAPWW